MTRDVGGVRRHLSLKDCQQLDLLNGQAKEARKALKAIDALRDYLSTQDAPDRQTMGQLAELRLQTVRDLNKAVADARLIRARGQRAQQRDYHQQRKKKGVS